MKVKKFKLDGYTPHRLPLEKVQHEQFATCLARNNTPNTCYIGVYGKDDAPVAAILASQYAILGRVAYLKSLGIYYADTRQS